MKRLLTILLLLPSLAWAADPIDWSKPLARGMGVTAMGAGVAAASDTNFCAGFTGLFCDDFEGSSTCGDDAASQANCRNVSAWSVVASGAGGTVTNQQSGLAGTYSKYLDAADAASASHRVVGAFSASASRIYAFAVFKYGTVNITSATDASIIALNSGTTSVCYITANSSEAFQVYSSAANSAIADAPALAADTAYCAWLSYDDNTSTTGCQAGIATATCSAGVCTCTKPTLTGLSSGSVGNVDGIRLYSRDKTTPDDADLGTFDNVKVQTGNIGDDGADL